MVANEEVFDYVVVGAGSAGCVLASRLTEDPTVRVLVREAGGRDVSPNIHMPAAYPRTFRTRYDWAYRTVPQPQAGGRSLYWPRGRVLGGSSSINAMVYVRGNAADYDEWAKLGNVGWGYDDVLPYFRRAERNSRGASAYHGASGPLSVSDLRSPHPWSLAFVEACLAAGKPVNPDFNGVGQEGAGLYQITQDGGRRCSAARAYLRPAQRRANLTVRTGALVVGLTMEGRRCVGVRYRRRGQVHRVRASREVLLAGGTVNSPQVLLLSGIGPADQLPAVGVDPVHDLPGVGAGLRDHPWLPVGYRTRAGGSLIAAQGPRELSHWLLRRRGMLTSTISEAACFSRSRPDLELPDLQYNFCPVRIEPENRVPTEHGLTVGVVLVSVASVGALRLRSGDPTEPPLIDPGYLTASEDVDALVAGLRLAREFADRPPLRRLVAGETELTGGARSADELRAAVRRGMETLFHPTSTCRMGVDALAVVDPELRVRGIDGLRVVDASVMPTLIRGNTNAPTIMIAERASDLIRGRRSAAAPVTG
jgi:choline dehydrogenase-like flavoprotein